MPDLNLQILSENIVIIAPHMDDEVLACGGMVAQLSDKNRIHVIYATDGSQSPVPVFRWQGKASSELGKIRMQESIDAMKRLDVPEQNLHFLCLPDSKLSKNGLVLQRAIYKIIKSIDPQFIFVPFRFDRHPDHLAVNHAIASEVAQDRIQARVVEYFVYHRWRLLPKRDIRNYVKKQYLFQLDIARVAKQKRQALDCFVSQATNFYRWQTRPILTSSLLDEECQTPEYFLITSGSLTGTDIFSSSWLWIQLAHRIEPVLLRWKSVLYSLVPRIFQNRVIESN